MLLSCIVVVVLASQPLHVSVNTKHMLTTTSDHFLCWNIDASRNRQFFDRGK